MTSTLQLPEDIWAVYRAVVPQNEDPKTAYGWSLREKLLVHYLYLTKRVVGKMKKSLPAHVEADDLESSAKIGLIQAVTRYDNTLSVPFEAFAAQRMRSCILDAIREADWAPRSLRKKQREIRLAEEAFVKTQERPPSQEELATQLDVSVGEVTKTRYQSSIASHAYLETTTEVHNKPAVLDQEEDDLVSLMKMTVSRCLYELPIKQAAVIALHYYEEKKLASVAQILKMSDVKLGNVHSEAVLYIWQQIQKALEEN